MNIRNNLLLSATAGSALLTSLFLLGCRVQEAPSDNSQQNKDGSPAATTNDGSSTTKKTPSKNADTDPSTDGDTNTNTDGDGHDAETPSGDTTVFSDMHWSTPNGAGVTFYDVELSSDGTYRKQQIILSGGGTLLHCEYGSWKTGSEAGKLALVSTCTGHSYEQSWSQNTAGNLVLQGVTYSKDPNGVWNCAPTECK